MLTNWIDTTLKDAYICSTSARHSTRSGVCSAILEAAVTLAHACMYDTRTYACTRTHIHTHMHAHTHGHIHTHECTRAHTRSHTHTHTHTHIKKWLTVQPYQEVLRDKEVEVFPTGSELHARQQNMCSWMFLVRD